ncbi:MAG: glutathione S-transferase [Gammaproteobacteria bacterium]|jgi:glutathione S-transferase
MKWILHHYDFSNFSEKVRLMLGYKGIAWDSVEIPSHLPKPDYTPLTGGYRRTPSLQIGADIYCDTRLIAEHIESACPNPSFYAGSPRMKIFARSIGDWAESRMLWPTALYITGMNADRFSKEFHSDRASLHGKPVPNVAQVKASAVKYLAQMRSELHAIEDLFVDDSLYVLGDELSLADISLYQIPWFLNTIEPGHSFLDQMPRTREWVARVAAIGHGEVSTFSAQGAIERANQSTPIPIDSVATTTPEGLAVGDPVLVSPMGELSPASGTLAFADDERVVIDVSNERLKHVRVHLPRSGYRLSRNRAGT